MYSAAKGRERGMEEAFRVYVTDALQMIPQNMYPSRRYRDLTRPRRDIDVDAVVDHVAQVLGEASGLAPA